MASLYPKKGSDRIWLRYKTSAGVWAGKQTDYHWSNFGEVRQAKLMARRQSEIEAERSKISSLRFGAWVLPWLIMRYGGAGSTTLDVYKRSWRNLERFLEHTKIETPHQIGRDFIRDYMEFRTGTDAPRPSGRNTAIGEIKLMSMVMEEAVNLGHCLTNPLRKPGLKKDKAAEKNPWEDNQISETGAHLEKHGTLWQRSAFYFGLFQACRLRQCQLPLNSILLDRGLIRYPAYLVKGMTAYTQPIDERFQPILKDLVKEAKKAGQTTICTVPWDASIRFRRTLDRVGHEDISHHGLRVTWITRAADNGVTENEAMAFCHHESREVHRIYKKLISVTTTHVPASVPLPAFRSSG